ncbi:uncharacterized protein Fot_31020 [Forsythia ovata]|uniref:Saposin B-type domain-containing protein n=1 Tax=Forsythia ovata TaxID=205694 RepID=A0ABD1T3V8_9LAMI
MAKSDQVSLLLVLCVTVIISSWMPISHCAKKPVGVARKEDIPFIKCQVCEKLASQVYHQVQAKQAEISPKKVSEYQIIEIAENVCNLKKQEADWILKIDIVEQGDRLELVEQDSEGQCNSECKTIERACQEVLGYSDTDVAEYLYKNRPDLDSLVNFICKDLTKACRKKPPPVPKVIALTDIYKKSPVKFCICSNHNCLAYLVNTTIVASTPQELPPKDDKKQKVALPTKTKLQTKTHQHHYLALKPPTSFTTIRAQALAQKKPLPSSKYNHLKLKKGGNRGVLRVTVWPVELVELRWR